MKQLEKFITDKRTGLKYELCEDYYIIADGDEPKREPIGIWGQRHLEYMQCLLTLRGSEMKNIIYINKIT